MSRVTLAATLVATSFVASVASASTLVASSEIPQLQSTTVRDFATRQVVSSSLPMMEADQIVYDNLLAPSVPNTAFTSLNTTNPTYGDDVLLTSGGTLREFYFTVFNGTTGGNTGSITGGALTVNFYDGLTFGVPASGQTPIGGFTANLTFASPLAPGFFRVEGFINLQGLGIELPEYVQITQRFVPTGTSNNNGIASLNPVNIGTSFPDFYLNRTGNPEGFYTLGPANAPVTTNLGYLIVVPEPTTLAGLAAVAVLGLRRRRA